MIKIEYTYDTSGELKRILMHVLSHLFQPQLYAQSSVLFSFLPYLSTSTSPLNSFHLRI